MDRISQDRNSALGLRALTARSVVLSGLLGAHPPRLRPREVVRLGALFGIAEGTIRVALSRMSAAGDLVQQDGWYQLPERLIERQERQDESRNPRVTQWRGTWEMVVVTADRRERTDRARFRRTMLNLLLAELREGVWLRPDNLLRSLPDSVLDHCEIFSIRPESDPAALAVMSWDLDGWADRARLLGEAMDAASGLADGFVVSAAVLQHLLADPVLPVELLPAGWPGAALRASYDEFDSAHRTLLRSYLDTD